MNIRNRRRPRLAGPILLLSVLLAGALASSPAAAQGTPEQRAACENDAMRLCGQFIPDVDRITACMKRNCARVSPRCAAAMYCKRSKRR
jgi:hypothetical protein